MRELARKNGIGFSVVIVPQGFDIDDRMWSQWKILADFREKYKHTLMASNFKKSLLENNIHVVNLYPALKAIKGTYLNVSVTVYTLSGCAHDDTIGIDKTLNLDQT